MPKQLTSINDAIGKTIAGATYDDDDEWISLLFTDGDYLIVETRNEGYLDFDPSLNRRMQLSVGLLTQEEWDRQRAEQDAAAARQRERIDREQYERLKAQFEG